MRFRKSEVVRLFDRKTMIEATGEPCFGKGGLMSRSLSWSWVFGLGEKLGIGEILNLES